MSTAENIKANRIRFGYSQEDLAKLVGYNDRSSITKIERGLVDLSESKIAAFARVFSITPAELMGYTVPVGKKTPASPEESERIKEFSELFGRLTPEQQTLIIAQMKGILLNQ